MTYTGKDKVIHILLWVVVILLVCILTVALLYRFGVFDCREEDTTAGTSPVTGTPAGTTAEGPGAHTEPGQTSAGAESSAEAAGSTSKAVATTRPEQNIDDVTTPAATVTGGQGTSEPVDPTSADPEGTGSPEHTTSPETPTSPQEHTTRTPGTTRDPHDTTRSPENTTAPHTNYTPDPALTIVPPTTMPDGSTMMNGDRFDDVLIAPDGTEVPGYWVWLYDEPEFVVLVPTLAAGETMRGWNWVPHYHILELGTYEGIGMGYFDFTPDVILPPFVGTADPMGSITLVVESGSWW